MTAVLERLGIGIDDAKDDLSVNHSQRRLIKDNPKAQTRIDKIGKNLKRTSTAANAVPIKSAVTAFIPQAVPAGATLRDGLNGVGAEAKKLSGQLKGTMFGKADSSSDKRE